MGQILSGQATKLMVKVKKKTYFRSCGAYVVMLSLKRNKNLVFLLLKNNYLCNKEWY